MNLTKQASGPPLDNRVKYKLVWTGLQASIMDVRTR